jgi:hypothetical protein
MGVENMDIEVIVEGEGFTEVEVFRLPEGSVAKDIVVAVAVKAGFSPEEGLLFIEDGEEPLDLALVIDEETVRGMVHC